jgi:SAM-dependent methyltransferase
MEPNPDLIFETLNAHQRSAALRGAIELDLFTAIARGKGSLEALTEHCQGTPRSVRILCDFLVIAGFLTKEDGTYGLSPTAAQFLDRDQPTYMGSVAKFVNSKEFLDAFSDVAYLVRLGSTTMSGEGSAEPDWEGWVEFARSMEPMMQPAARQIAAMVKERFPGPLRVLDVAAGHGAFGIAIAEANPEAEIVALDWKKVLKVAQERAEAAGVADRYTLLPGDAMTVDYGEGYDVVLLTNFLHHFDRETCVAVMKKVHASLAPSGIAVTLEFVPNEDRVSPPVAATFSFMMLGTTSEGDAYTFVELDSLCREAGFSRNALVPLEHSAQCVVVSDK